MRSRLKEVRSTRDAGAYAILFALLLVLIVGTASVVVDLAIMRESRAQTRSAADAAVVAGAAALNAIDAVESNPRVACQQAWAYLLENLGDLDDGSADCDDFPTDATSCPSAAQRVVTTDDPWTIRISWPVPDSDTLLTSPDSAPAAVTQAVDADVDGLDPCGRFAVEVFRTNQFGLAGIFGISEGTTRAASVARAIVDGQTSRSIAALNVLERERCGALITSGQGFIQVDGFEDRAGLIAVESSGTATGNSCNGNNTAVVQPSANGNNYIEVNGPNGTGTGFLQVYALNAPPDGNPGKASVFPERLSPDPTLLTERYGPDPVTDLYDCASTVCPDGGGSYISELEDRFGGVGAPDGFQTLPNPALVPDFVCEQNSNSPPVLVPVGDWYIDCDTFSVATTVVFRGGDVVTRGRVDLGSGSACLAINAPVTVPITTPPTPPPCPTVIAGTSTSPATTNPAPLDDAIFYIRTGRLYKVSQASLLMPQTFTYLGNGWTDLGGGTGTLLWTTPLAESCNDNLACEYERFSRLVLWSEYAGTEAHRIGGQANLELRGALFTPNAASVFAGQSNSSQTEAQFWTRTLEVTGQSGLIMVADPDASISRPSSGVALIR